MQTILLAVLLFIPLLCFQKCPIENGWKGIQVFRTTRNDVEKILGASLKDGDELKSNYENNDVLVHVIYSSGQCVEDPRGRGKYRKIQLCGTGSYSSAGLIVQNLHGGGSFTNVHRNHTQLVFSTTTIHQAELESRRASLKV